MFQYGWGEALFDFESTGAIASWLPIFLFVILFGLSMDYHVFVLSRIREGVRQRVADTRSCGARYPLDGRRHHGGRCGDGGGVHALHQNVADLAQSAGLSLAAAVFIDATLVRGVLLPAVMTMLGERNWYLPRWLRWLPDVSHGELPDPVEPRQPAPDLAKA
jgi:uncharacterized membrane protein YdfJ with MMPL/SSD domain